MTATASVQTFTHCKSVMSHTWYIYSNSSFITDSGQFFLSCSVANVVAF